MLRAFLAVGLCLICASALADLQVFPTRIYLSDTKKVSNVSLRHFGEKPGNYRVTAVFYRMDGKGKMEPATDPTPEERPLLKHLRFSPRNVTIQPNTEQVVRVMFSGPGSLAEGEYRAHLHFEPTDDGDAKIADAGDKIQMQLNVRVAFAVPVIYRRGNPAFQVNLTNPQVITPTPAKDAKAPASQAIEVSLDWKGNAFPFGDLHAFFKAKDGDEKPAGVIKGVAAYINPVAVKIPLFPDVDPKAGTLRVEFREPEDRGGKILRTVETAIP